MVEGPHGNALWKSIVSKWVSFRRGIKIVPGDGSTISFWHDVWLGEAPLCDRFRVFYNLAQNRNAWISDYLYREEGRVVWDVLLRRSLNDWEVDDYLSLMEGLHQVALLFCNKDRWLWEWGRNDEFSVKSYYAVLVRERMKTATRSTVSPSQASSSSFPTESKSSSSTIPPVKSDPTLTSPSSTRTHPPKPSSSQTKSARSPISSRRPATSSASGASPTKTAASSSRVYSTGTRTASSVGPSLLSTGTRLSPRGLVHPASTQHVPFGTLRERLWILS